MTAKIFSFELESDKRRRRSQSRQIFGLKMVKGAADMVARQANQPFSITDELNHDGYLFMPLSEKPHVYQAGWQGINDFLHGVEQVIPDTKSEDSLAKRCVSVLYGIYGASKILLPRIIEISPISRHNFERLIGKHGLQQDDEPIELAYDQAIGYAAAKSTLQIFSQGLKSDEFEHVQALISQGKFVKNAEAAEDFRTPFSRDDLWDISEGILGR